MTTQNSMISLARLHKVVDRLKERANQLASELATAALADTPFISAGATLTKERIEQYRREANSFNEKLMDYLQINDCVAALRAKISAHNEATGISALLAKNEVVSRAKAKLQAMLPEANVLPLDSLTEGLPLAGLAFGRLTAAQVAGLRDTVDQLTAEGFQLTDKIAALNAQVVSVELPEKLHNFVMGKSR